MPARFRTKDRVLETSVTTGTGTYTLAGAATGFQTFRGGDVAANDLVPYFAEDGTNWEAGIGTVLSGPDRLERTTVLKSSNANAAVDWGAGTKNLRCGWPAELNTPRMKSVSIAGGAGTQVLTQDEQRCDILVLTGALTGNRTIEVDTAPWSWPAVYNNTSGAYTVTLKVNGATGVILAQGARVALICDGTDVRPISSGGTTVPRLLENVGLAVTMAANAVTIALKGADGADPSAGNVVGIGFRDATITNGQSSKVQVSAAASVAISSGSTGGTVSAQASRIWVGAILVAGAVELAWFNARSGTKIAPINEGGLISTTAEGGAGAADSAQVWYSTTARANVPVTILGYFDSTQATAGTWAAAADAVVVNPRYRPGDVVQVQENFDGAVASGSTAIPNDDSIPQSGEGTQFMTQAITPTAAANILRWRAVINTSANASAVAKITALFQDAVADAIAAVVTEGGVGGASQYDAPGVLDWSMLAGTTSSTTGKIRVGSNGGDTFTFNGQSAARRMGGAMASLLRVEEICA